MFNTSPVRHDAAVAPFGLPPHQTREGHSQSAMPRAAAAEILAIDLPANADWLDLTNRASALFVVGRDQEALSLALQAVDLARNATTCINVAVILEAFGRFTSALFYFREAHRLDPGSIVAGGGYADALLRLGEWESGWPLYARYHSLNQLPALPALADLSGGRIFVAAGGGFGDNLYHLRWFRDLHERNVHITYGAPASLIPLLARHPWIDAILPMPTDQHHISWAARGEATSVRDGILHLNLREFDYITNILALPAIVGARLDSAWPGPYVTARASLASRVARRISSRSRIGVNWKAGEWNFPRAHRSLSDAQTLSLLASRPAADWTSLTLDEPPPTPIRRPSLRDWRATAQAVAACDLIVTVDTSIAHLAGAMGKPTWVILPGASAWQYLTDSAMIPVYPTMRLFRNSGLGIDNAVAVAVAALETL